MNFYVNSQGQIIRVDPEDVFQGSVNANTINFVGAFPSTCPVNVAFRLPTGEWTTPASMGMNSELSGVQQPDGTQFNIWRYTIPGTVTEYYGTVNLQFYVYAQGSSGSGNTIATAASSFEVKRGVPVTLPDPSDDYETLLTQILSALQQLQQADSEGALAAQQSATAAAASATQAATSAVNASYSETQAAGYAISAATSETAAKAAQAAAEAAQAGAEEAEQNAQTLVNNAQDIAETTASGIVNNLLQNGGTFEGPVNFNNSVNIKETLTFGDPSTQAGAQIDYRETGMSYDSIEQGKNLSGQTLLFNTGTDVSSSVDWGDPQSALTLMTFANGASLVVGGDDSLVVSEDKTEYAFYLLYNGQKIFIVQNGAWVKNEYVLAGSGWTVSSVTSYDSLVTDAQRAIAESFISQEYIDMPLSRFDDGVKSEYMAEANDDLTNKQYVDGQVAAEATTRQNADNALRNSKYDKTGGTIGGDVQITGDLTVNGTTTTNDAETLQVKDNYIVTNSDGATLAGYSGVLIRTNSTVTYGITYDPVSNAVLLGQGVYNAENGTFSFNSGEGLPVAIRAVSTSWTNGDIAVWDSTNNQFVDSGKSLSDLQEALTFDNVPTQGSNNPVTSGGIYTALQDYVTSESLITVLSSYATLSGNNTFTGNNTFDSPITVPGFANESYSYTLPNESGTIALTSDITEAITNILNSKNTWSKENTFERGLDITGQINIHDSDTSIARNGTLIVTGSMVYLQNYKINEYYYAASLNNAQYNIDENIIGSVDYFIDGIYLTPLTDDKANIDTDKGYFLKFPNKAGTIALTSDITTALTPVQESVSSLQQSVSALQTQTGDLSQSVNDIYTILQQEVYTSQDITQEYSSRETADGADIIDGALATLKTVQGATVKTTNLLPFPYLDGASYTQHGVTVTANSDGSITINGTPTDYVYYKFISDFRGVGKFILSGIPSSANLSFTVTVYNSAGNSIGTVDGYRGETIQFNTADYEGYDHARLRICRVMNGVAINNVTVYPMLNTGDSALPYMPYFTGLKNAYFKGLRSTGRNLIPFPYSENTETINGVTFTVNDDGSVTVNGTATSQINFFFASSLKPILTFPIGTVLSISGCPSGGSGSTFFLNLLSTDYIEGIIDVGNGGTITTTKKSYYLYFRIEEGVTLTNAVIRPMLNYGSSALPYEPYVSHEISLDAAIELPAWDSINPTTGKRIVQSNTLVFDGTESGWYTDQPTTPNIIYIIITVPDAKDSNSLIATITKGLPPQNPDSNTGCYINISDLYTYFVVWFRQSAYPNITDLASAKAQLVAWNTAGNPLTICYKTATATESDIEMEDRLPAYKNGSETVIQGDTDNSEYGAENTLTQNYAEVKGGTQS